MELNSDQQQYLKSHNLIHLWQSAISDDDDYFLLNDLISDDMMNHGRDDADKLNNYGKTCLSLLSILSEYE